MQNFESYFFILAWSIVIALTMAVAYGFSIWIFDKMIVEVKYLRGVAKRPIAIAIVLAAFMYSVALVISAILK
ncbi:MAG: hypothetical protein NTZ49_04320 [Candidatus Parcubacteria bacterium]|nr:hypothetical protein [Candidatus Parcubacteria bacterium]